MKAPIEILDSCPSTNAVLAARPDLPHGYTVVARSQTAGRGQRGNSWEAEPGKNLTFSLLLRPKELPVTRQFELSMVVALAVKEAIDNALAAYGSPLHADIKWSNDIYVADKKICGILIENKLAGINIERSVVGIGINVNQTVFLSDAPNPTSLALLTGAEVQLEQLLEEVVDTIVARFDAYELSPAPSQLKAAYMACLTRTSGMHPFTDAQHGRFYAHITDVDFDGTLTLSNGCRYAFKELTFNLL